MEDDKYKKLFKVSSKIEEMLKLKKEDGILNNFIVETIPDDNKIEIFASYKGPIKDIKTTIMIGKKRKDEDTK